MSGNVVGRAAASVFMPAVQVGVRWMDIAALALFALLLRLVFSNGPFGSDDVIYFQRAIDVAQGIWSSANYNGSLRYGFNIPAGVLVHLFGATPFVANLWPLSCSVGEVVLVYLIASMLWHRKAGLCAGLVLASMPLHVAVATRIHPDSVVAFFLSLGFVLLLMAERRRSLGFYFLAGLAMGAVYWTKELAAVTLFALLGVAVLRPQPLRGWLYVGFGAAAMFMAHLALMQWIAGDPLHAIKTAMAVLGRAFDRGVGEDAAGYYLHYLFLNPRHTWFAGFLALLAIVSIARDANATPQQQAGQRYVVVWLVSLLVVLSLFPVSLSPLKLTLKQSNYLTLFLAPLALLAGYAIASLPQRVSLWVLAAAIAGGAVLGAMQQADYRAFTANSKAVVAFAKLVPHATVVGSTNNSLMSGYDAALSDRSAPLIVRSFADMANGAVPDPPSGLLYAVIDPQTTGWMPYGRRVDAPLRCWTPVMQLEPARLGAGNAIAGVAASMLNTGPAMLQSVAAALERLARPLPATVYEVNSSDLWCGTGARH